MFSILYNIVYLARNIMLDSFEPTYFLLNVADKAGVGFW